MTTTEAPAAPLAAPTAAPDAAFPQTPATPEAPATPAPPQHQRTTTVLTPLGLLTVLLGAALP